MKPRGNLLAWINPCKAGEFVAAFIGEGAVPGAYKDFPGRSPATQFCSSPDEARQWIEDQAAALDLPVKWVREIPREPVPDR
jgi:hypothetical protein